MCMYIRYKYMYMYMPLCTQQMCVYVGGGVSGGGGGGAGGCVKTHAPWSALHDVVAFACPETNFQAYATHYAKTKI